MKKKRAIGYIRISTKDQSNFSLEGQENYIRDFCAKQEWELINIFKDDGQSAKNFDRPDWKDLETFVRRNHDNVDILIVSKFDRFSRNVSEALQMIELLEKRFTIRVMSVMEPIMLHPNSPYFFQFRTQMLLGAQVEWLVIRDRTKSGNHQAAKAGRYINMAPYGYKNARDDRNKPILIIDEKKAQLVKEMYQRFVLGDTMAQVRQFALEKGFPNRSNSAIQKLLTTPTYAGLIRVPEYYDEPEKLVKGIHEGIVSEMTWWKAQDRFSNKKAMNRTIINDDVPLRGKLKCFCGRHFTAGRSKGKKMYVWYYICFSHRQNNLNAKRLHAQFDEILKELSLPQFYIEYLQERVIENMNARMKDRDVEITQKKSTLLEVNKKLDNLEEKYLQNDIDRDTFKKWQTRYYKERSVLTTAVSELNSPLQGLAEQYQQTISRLGDLHYIYEKATTTQKQRIVGWVFDNKLYYQEGIYRTPFIQPLFASKVALLKEKRLLEIEQPQLNSQISGGCTRERN